MRCSPSNLSRFKGSLRRSLVESVRDGCFAIKDRELTLRSCIALGSRKAKPLCCFSVALWYALAIVVHDAELILTDGVALVS